MSKIQDLFSLLWRDYIELNPIAREVHGLLEARGEKIINDHIALRTFNGSRFGINVLSKSFVEGGYAQKGEYHFEVKKLYAQHFEHPDPEMPKVFISELKTEEFSSELQKTIAGLLEQVPEDYSSRWDFAVAGRPWKVEHSTYEALAAESEYAGWMSAFGFRANHFTVNVNQLSSFPTLESLNSFLKEKGIQLNTSGGEIKGSEGELLEQSSTLANVVAVPFDDGAHSIPACYYEFAKRYPDQSGKLYQGFVAKSADKIFESTDRQ